MQCLPVINNYVTTVEMDKQLHASDDHHPTTFHVFEEDGGT